VAHTEVFLSYWKYILYFDGAYASFPKIKSMILYDQSEHFLYCRTQNLKQKADILAVLISPFDKTSWILLVVFVSLCFIPGFRFCTGMIIISTVLVQSTQVQRVGYFSALLAIVLIPIQSAYQTYYASNAVKPFEKAYIDTNQELFDSGFKMLCPVKFENDKTICSEVDWYNESFRKLNLSWNTMEQYFLNFTDWGVGKLSHHLDEGAYLMQRKMKYYTLLSETTPDTECHMVAEAFIEDVNTLFYGGTYSQNLYNTFGKIKQAGIPAFWKTALQTIIDSNSIKTAKSVAKTPYESEIAYMNNAIQSLLKIIFVLEAFNIVTFIVEVSIPYILAKWIRWKERRRYLRAIWPLGRI